MSEEQSPLIVNPTIEKPKRNWKRTLLILFILLFFVSLIGIGLYLLVPKLDEGSPSTTQEQATPSAKKAEHPLKNKIIYTKTN